MTEPRYRRSKTGLRQFVALQCYPFLAHAERRAPIHFIGRMKGHRFVLHVRASQNRNGLATLHDGDVLMVLAVLLIERLDNSEPLDAPIVITSADLLERLGQEDNGRQRDLLQDALVRLCATEVYTDLRGRPQRFHLIENVIPADLGDRPALHLTLPTFLLDEIRAQAILDVDPVTLTLSSLERRIYGWARARIGLAPGSVWRFDYEQAHVLSAWEAKPQDFARAIRDLILADRLPSYTLSRAHHHDRPCLHVTARVANQSTLSPAVCDTEITI